MEGSRPDQLRLERLGQDRISVAEGFDSPFYHRDRVGKAIDDRERVAEIARDARALDHVGGQFERLAQVFDSGLAPGEKLGHAEFAEHANAELRRDALATRPGQEGNRALWRATRHRAR